VGLDVAVGRLLSGRYQVDKLLGSGGMATVWRGWDLRLDRAVAIKELTGPWLADPTAMARFDREARTAARLAHPNIVSVHDVGSHYGSPFLVMELIEGPTVAEMLRQGPLPIAQAIAIAAQTCDALTAAHEAGIIHRDIKPANLIVTPAGVVKICDFGIARALLDTTDLTGPMSAIGSGKFMAPEQADGVAEARTDLYSLGCTMYAMLTGRVPFYGDSAELRHLHRSQPPVPIREHRADVGLRLEALVAQLLAKTPAARPTSAVEVKARLEEIRPDPETTATPLPLTTEEPHTRRIGTCRAAVGGTLIVLAAAAMSLGATSWSRSVTSESPAQWRPAVIASPVTVTQGPPPTSGTPSIEPGRPAAASTAVQETHTAPKDPIATMRLSIQQQVNGGHLNPDKASDLYKKVDEIARAISDNNTELATRKIKELRGKLATLLAEGQLTTSGHDALLLALDLIAAAAPNA
jgi:serine/threonine protein kinase